MLPCMRPLHFVRTVVVAIAIALSVSLAPAPAGAESWSGNDPQGDGAAAADLSAVSLNHKEGAAIVKLRFHTAKRKKVDSVFIALYVKGSGGRGFLVNGGRDQGGPLKWEVFYGLPFSDGGADPVSCPGLQVTWLFDSAPKTLKVRVPRSCLKPSNRKMALSAQAATLTKGDAVPDDGSHGPWLAAG